MRTNIVIDDKLMADAMKLSGAGTKREVVELAFKQKDILELVGQDMIAPDYDVRAVILVDSSVWIDLLRDVQTLRTLALRELLPRREAAPTAWRHVLRWNTERPCSTMTAILKCWRKSSRASNYFRLPDPRKDQGIIPTLASRIQ